MYWSNLGKPCLSGAKYVVDLKSETPFYPLRVASFVARARYACARVRSIALSRGQFALSRCQFLLRAQCSTKTISIVSTQTISKPMDAQNDISNWISSIPKITRFWFFSFFAVPLTTRLGLIDPMTLIMLPELVFSNFQVSNKPWPALVVSRDRERDYIHARSDLACVVC